jgi:hypothetical protein
VRFVLEQKPDDFLVQDDTVAATDPILHDPTCPSAASF